MALTWPLEAQFELFWVLVANGSQQWGHAIWTAAGTSGGQMALRLPLEAHFEFFWALVAKLLSDCLWRLILNSSGLW